MKNFYLACVTEENGKYYAHAAKVSQNTNILSALARIPNLKTTNICNTKKQAEGIVAFWNNCYKQNGTYLFDTPKF